MDIPFPLAQLCATIAVLVFVGRQRNTIESFLVADRKVAQTTGMFSVTANWIQAPAILASGVLAYTSPWHFLYFIVPNVLALMLPGILAPYIQRSMPQGYTLPQFIEQTYGSRVRTLLFLASTFALTGAVGYTFIGLKTWFATEFNISAIGMVLFLGMCAAIWAMPHGLRGAIVGDQVKVFAVTFLMIGVGLLWVTPHGEMHAVQYPLANTTPLDVFMIVGIPLAISLVGGPLCNPDLAERMYALDARTVRRSYIKAALLFGIAALTFGSLGLLARVYELDASKGPPAFVVLKSFAPTFIPMVGGMLIVILTAALSSLIASSGDLFSIELIRRLRPSVSDTSMIMWSRFFMLIPIGFGLLIASQGWSIDYVLKGMAAARGEAIFPVVAAVFWPKVFRGTAMFYGMLFGFIFGLGAIFTPSITGLWGPTIGATIAFLSPILLAILDRFWTANRG